MSSAKITQAARIILPIYWIFLTYMLLKPGQDLPVPFFHFEGVDKVIHLGIFITLGLLFSAAFPRTNLWWGGIILVIYCILTEVLQEKMGLGRTGDPWDLFADGIGLLIGYLIYRAYCIRFMK